MKTIVCVKYFVDGCVGKQLFASCLLQISSTLICLTIFVALMLLTQFQPPIKSIDLQKSAKICLNKFLPDLFTEVQI